MPNLIDRVEVGDMVDIRFSNFSLTPLLVVPGTVTSISTDVLFQEKTKQLLSCSCAFDGRGFEETR